MPAHLKSRSFRNGAVCDMICDEGFSVRDSGVDRDSREGEAAV